MRRTDILDNPDRELTQEDLFELLEERLQQEFLFQDGSDPDSSGCTMLVFDSWEDLVQTGAILNGWEGGQIAVVYRADNVEEKLKTYKEQLDYTRRHNPEHLGTISRLESGIVKLQNYLSYNKWLEDNQYQARSLEDFEGITLGFSDEYSPCGSGNCTSRNIVRIAPDSYSWTPPLFVEDQGYVCDECAEDFKDYVLEEYKNEPKSIPENFFLSDLGLEKINEHSYENGYHRGQDDSPIPIIESLNKEGIDVWFKVHPSQFYLEFDVYVKEDDVERSTEILERTNTYQGYSTSGRLKESLDKASEAMASLPSEGIKYANIDIDNDEVEVRTVSQEEFVKGIKKK